jgi:signal peptidase I
MRVLDRSLSRLPRPVRTAVDWCLTIAIACGAILLFQAEVAKPYRIPTASMEPTLHCARPATACEARFSDRVIANRLVYRLHDPERGDVIVFETSRKVETACGIRGTFVKRIVGLPGERLVMRNGHVWIDGVRLREPYLANGYRGTETGAWPRVPADSYFVLGDNRSMSCDSRDWGAVRRGDIIGRADIRYWPPRRFGQP